MSWGLFEHLSYTEEENRSASRKALALARARANTQFGRLIANATSEADREARLALVAGDIEATVRQACADVDYSDWESVHHAVQSHLGMTVESVRRPKMCPYHKEVTDISLAAGEPQAGFSAMAQHAWGSNHCQGEWDGRCNFKPDMVTQTYWDNKAEQAEQRRLERQQQMEQQQEVQNEQPVEEPVEDIAQEPVADSGMDETLWADPTPATPEPSAVGSGSEPVMARRKAATVPQPIIHPGSLMVLDKISGKKPGLAIDGVPYDQWRQSHSGAAATAGQPVEVTHPHPTWEGIIADVLRVGHEGPLQEEMLRRQQARQQQAPRTAEALKTIDVEKSVGPVPKMDKRKWTVENVQFLDVEMDGSPHPTRHVDIAEPANYSETNDPLEGANAVLERQDVTKGSDFSSDKAHGQWPSGGDRSAVSSVHEADLRADLAQGYNPGAGSQELSERIPQQLPGSDSGFCPGCNTPVHGRWGVCPSCNTDLSQMHHAAQDPDVNPIREHLNELPSEEEIQRALEDYQNER